MPPRGRACSWQFPGVQCGTLHSAAASLAALQEADGLVLVNIDRGSVTLCSSDDSAVPDIPLMAAQTFIQRWG